MRTRIIHSLISTIDMRNFDNIDQNLVDIAKEYALKRTEIAREARSVVEGIIMRYAERYDPDDLYIDNLKSECVNDIMYVIRQYANAAGDYLQDLDNGVDAYINETHDGLTYEQRMEEYVDRLFSDFAKLSVAFVFGTFGSKPRSQVMREQIVGAYNEGGVVRIAIDNGADIVIPKYGRGISKDAATQIMNSVENMINAGWGYAQWDKAVRDGAKGFIYYRGSSYPCQICQEQVGYHRIDDEYFSAPPMHARCVCFVVYIY